jgi:YHS domain-containing protein/ketosteroid isomerase-like protein
MSDARTIVEVYLRALYSGDRRTARQQLADDVSFEGPAARFTSADEYLTATEHAVRAVTHVEMDRILADAADVAVLYDLHIDHPVGSVTVGDWYHVTNGKITSIRTILDTAPFAVASGDTAVDPVCGMTVARASAVATRVHGDTTYYFCTRGCAEAFDLDPRRYASA